LKLNPLFNFKLTFLLLSSTVMQGKVKSLADIEADDGRTTPSGEEMSAFKQLVRFQCAVVV
jgi:hypothetical protein